MKIIKKIDDCISVNELRNKITKGERSYYYNNEINQLNEFKKYILEDSALKPLMSVYYHIQELEENIKNLEKKLEESNKTIEYLKDKVQTKEEYLREYRREFGQSTAEKKREARAIREKNEDGYLMYKELCDLGAFCDDY